MLSDIEEALGFLLFERNARGMQPTPLGTVTLAYARRSLADLTRFAADLESKRRGGHGQLTVGAIMGAAPDVLAMAVAELKSERPLLNVRILGETSDQVVQLLHRREVDLALGRLTTPLQHNDFDFEPLAREAMRLVVRAKHPLAGRAPLALDALIAWPWILQPITSPARGLFEEELARAGLSSPSNVVECASIFATLQLLQNSDAVAMLPESVVRDYLRAQVADRTAGRDRQEPVRLRLAAPQGRNAERAGRILHRAVAQVLGGFAHCRLTNRPPSTSSDAPVT